MSKIFGIFYLNNDRTFEQNKIRDDFNHFTKDQNDKSDIWFGSKIGLAKENNYEISSRFISSNNLSIVSDACLTNHTELFEKFGVLPSERIFFCDERLILLSFEKWGVDCVEHLVGDFAFAVWDESNQKLFCARDHLGNRTLYFYKDNGRFIFGSTPNEILLFKNVEKKFNKNKLAKFIQTEPHTLASEQSWFENIHPISAGTTLKVNREGTLKTRQYWEAQPKKKPVPYKNSEEVFRAFRELMFEVIRAPLLKNKSVSALLSGGLDSSTIVSVAAKILEEQNKELTVFSSVLGNLNDKHFSDERFFIDQFKSVSNINIKYLSAPEKGPFSDLETLTQSGYSPINNSRHYLFSSFLEEADNIGSDAVLDGSYGEIGPTYLAEGAFAEMLSNLQFLRLRHELKMRKKLKGESIKYNLRAKTINPFLPKFIKNIRRNQQTSSSLLYKYHPLKDKLFNELLQNTEFQTSDVGTLFADHRKSQAMDISYLQQKITDVPPVTHNQLNAVYRYPFLNKKLVEFCLALPLEFKIKDGYTRYLVRAGLDKILPPKIQWRTSKTPFSPDYIRRYFAQINSIREFLLGIKSNDPICEIVDIDRISRWVDLSIEETESYTTYDYIAFNVIPQSIYLIYFLRSFSEFRQ